MVYCTRCGATNPDDAKICTQCGVPLLPREEPIGKQEREKIIHAGTIVGLAVGIIILLAGLVWVLQQIMPDFPIRDVRPFAYIIFGIVIIYITVSILRHRT